jgi:hypothetical protein
MSRPRPDWRSISKSDRPVPSGYARIYARAVLDFRAAFEGQAPDGPSNGVA